MATEAAKGQEAMKISDYPTAINHYTAALRHSQSPLWLIQRSIAHQRIGKHELSLIDADNALLASMSRGKRELIATSHLRRAVALHGLGRFGDARLCLTWCHRRNDKEKGLTIWMAKVKGDFEKSGGDEAECNRITVKEVPDKPEEANGEPAPKEEKPKTSLAVDKSPAVPVAPVVLTPTPKDKIRTEWYQSTATVTIEVFAKGVPKENAAINIEEGSLDVSFPIPSSNSTYDYTLSPLFSRIDASKSTFRITPHKIEIVLHKSLPGVKWSSLEGTEPISSSTVKGPATTIPDPIPNPEKAPSYPTSSKNGPKNWDTVVQDEKIDEVEEADDFFKKLYQDSDPDTRRAMMKSYQESNGTSLSTDWGQVGSTTFQTMPPDGMEAKKWGT